MRRTLHTVTCATVVSLLLSGCGVAIPLAGSRNEEPPCTAEFDIQTAPEQLGSNERFLVASRTAAETPGLRITIADVARNAGWRDTWDHMLTVFNTMTNDEINTAAGTSGICYNPVNEPYRSSGSSEVSSGAYLFLRNGTPVQSASWYADQGVFDIDDALRPRPHPKTLLLRSEPSDYPKLKAVTDTPPG